jgi:hypothetical protein
VNLFAYFPLRTGKRPDLNLDPPQSWSENIRDVNDHSTAPQLCDDRKSGIGLVITGKPTFNPDDTSPETKQGAARISCRAHHFGNCTICAG